MSNVAFCRLHIEKKEKKNYTQYNRRGITMHPQKEKKEKKKFYLLILLLLLLFFGIGYAILSERLTMKGTVDYDTMNWNVGFYNAVDGGGTVLSNASISTDKKTITLTCNVGSSTLSETCIAQATVKNEGTFNIKLNETPNVTYDEKYINSVDILWVNDSTKISVNDSLAAGTSKDVQIKITTKELGSGNLPTEDLSIPVSISMNWIEDNRKAE